MSPSVLNSQLVTKLSSSLQRLATSLVSAPIYGYSGSCPFLRSLASISTSIPSRTRDYLDGQIEEGDELKKNHYQEKSPNKSNGGCPFLNCGAYSTSLKPPNVDADESAEAETGSQMESSKITPRQVCKSSYDYESRLAKLIEMKKSDGSYRVFRKLRRLSSEFPLAIEQSGPVTVWCSNDYFGMSSHPKVREAAEKALRESGTGSGGTRNIAGNNPLHEQLEWEIADLHEKEAALLFSSCFVANDSTLFTLLRLIPDCEIFSDAGNHASMIQGIRNSGARRHIFKSLDCRDLEEKLSSIPREVPKLVAFETVHSMSGDVSPVDRMCDIAHAYGALTYVDEVHAVGLYGARGAGIGQQEGCMHKIDIVSGTLGKAFGNFGGYIAGSRRLIDVVRSYAAGFIFTTSLPPSVLGGAIESVRLLKGSEGRQLRELQQVNVRHLKRSLEEAGLPAMPSKSHIVPLLVGEPTRCANISSHLLELGHYIQSINYPTVARGSERLRISISPFHCERMIDQLVEKLVAVWAHHGLEHCGQPERRLRAATGSGAAQPAGRGQPRP